MTEWLRPNQSLKLTEPAVDDFARAKKYKLRKSDRHARAMGYKQYAVRRGPLGYASKFSKGIVRQNLADIIIHI